MECAVDDNKQQVAISVLAERSERRVQPTQHAALVPILPSKVPEPCINGTPIFTILA